MATTEQTETQSVLRIKRWRRVEEPREAWWPWGILPLLGFLLLAAFALAYFARTGVQSDVARQAEEQLKAAGYKWVKVEADGQQVHIRGTAPEPVSKSTLVALAKTTECNTVFGRMQCPTDVTVDIAKPPPPTAPPPPPPPPPPVARKHDFEFERFRSRVMLRGEVPSEEVRQRIVSAAEKHFDSVTDELQVTDAPPLSAFDEASQGAMQIVTFLVSGKAAWSGQRLGVNGVVAEGKRADIERILAALGSDNQGELTLLEEKQATACDDEFSAKLSRSKIQFATASATVRQTSMPLLENLAQIARKCPVTLQIEGHTDNVGSDESNEALSLRRAAAVRDVLSSLGIEDERLIPLGFGERQPLADNATAAGKAKNRRIEIRIRR